MSSGTDVCRPRPRGRVQGRLRGRGWLRGFFIGALIAGLAAAGPWAWRDWGYYSHLRAARNALGHFVADNAIYELTFAEKLRPDSAEIQYLLGVANRKAGHLDNVRAHLERAAELGWPKKDIRFQLILLAFQAGDHDAEAELKQMALRLMDDDTAEQLYESWALGYLSEYRANDAMMVLDHWTQWRPDCVRARLLRAEIFDILSQAAKEEEEYRKVLEVDPRNYAAHLGLAHVLQLNHDSEPALEHFRFCRREWPEDPVAGLGTAACLQQQGKLAEAKQVLNEMRSQEFLPRPQRAVVLSELAEMAEQGRDLALAVELLSEAVELDPNNEQWQFRLGVCLARSGNKEEAKRYTQRSKEIELLQERRSDLELEMLSRPDDPEVRYEVGALLQKLGYPKPSAAMMLSVLRWDPNHQGAHAALADYYDTIDRPDLAQKHRAALAPNEPPAEDPRAEEPDAPGLSRTDGSPSLAGAATDH